MHIRISKIIAKKMGMSNYLVYIYYLEIRVMKTPIEN
jgi:hypothetical protein